jgi:hypothetical protein
MDDGHFVAALPVRTPDRSGYPLHRYTSDGLIVSSFGSLTREFGPGVQQSLSRIIAKGADGVIWAGHVYRYEITAWDTTNEIRRRIVRTVNWFPPRTDEAHAPDDPPQTHLNALFERPDGTLWAAFSVADPDWRRSLKPDNSGVTSEMDYRDSVVDLLDPVGRLLGEGRVDGIVTGFLPNDRVVVSEEDEYGFPYVSIMKAMPPAARDSGRGSR